MISRGILGSLMLALTWPSAASSPPAGPVLASPPAVSRWPDGAAWERISRAWYRGGRITVVVDAAGPAEMEPYRVALAQLGTGSQARVIEARQAAVADLQGPILILGSAGSHAAAVLERTPIAPMLPLREGETVRVMSVNPWDTFAAMMIVSGPDDGAVRGMLGRAGSGWGMRGVDYEFHRDGMRVCHGRFARHAEGAWRIEPAGSADLRGLLAMETVSGVDASYVRGELLPGTVREGAREAGAVLRGFVSRLGGTSDGARLGLVLYPDRETKAVRTGDPRWSHFEAVAGGGVRVHAVAPGPGREFADRIALARAAIAIGLGRVEPGALSDGVALWLSGDLMERPLDWWGDRLDRSGLRMTADELFDGEAYGRRTYLIGMPSAALMVRRLLAGLTPAEVRSTLRDAAGARQAAKAMPPPAPRPASSGAARSPATGPPRRVASFQKGMSLSHEGYAVTDGYGSAAAAEQMRRLAGMGVDWIGLSPYGFMHDPGVPEISFLEDERQNPGTENDVAVLSSIHSAHQLGLKVMLKPQLWMPRGRWTGDVVMASADSWRLFFTRYREFLAHYALLAEAGGADLLVVGVELQQTTSRESDWRALIAVARSLYDGPLTYAANWGEEFEQIRFWDALDHAGLDCYYPLAAEGGTESGTIDDRLLAEGARDVARRVELVSRRSGRSVILTEAGFPALAAAWRAPHDEDTGASPETGAQERCYRALLGAIWDQPWLAGVFWWKWPTTPPGARREPLFSPRGNPAEHVIVEWYAKARRPAMDWPSRSSDWSKPITARP